MAKYNNASVADSETNESSPGITILTNRYGDENLNHFKSNDLYFDGEVDTASILDYPVPNVGIELVIGKRLGRL